MRRALLLAVCLATVAAVTSARRAGGPEQIPPPVPAAAELEGSRTPSAPASDARGGTRLQRELQVNVSNAPQRQREVSIAVDPSNPAVLVAGSNSRPGSTRAYASTDGGATWTSTSAPALPPGSSDACGTDPAVGIDLRGRQYFAFAVITPCGIEGQGTLLVATRTGPRADWVTPEAPIAAPERGSFDDKPALAVDTSPDSPYSNRAYVAWTRYLGRTRVGVLLSRSDDGRTWSAPVSVNSTKTLGASYASIGIARDGTVYVAWEDWVVGAIRIARSTDGGATFGQQQLVSRVVSKTLRCDPYGTAIPAAPRSCVRPNPVVSVDRSRGPFAGRVYVTYANPARDGSEDVYVAAFRPDLSLLAGFPRRVNRTDRRYASDQFWPASALDPAGGTLWVCFYDTSGDPTRVRAVFSCTASRDGGRTWPAPVRAASVASNERQAAADSGPEGREYGDYQGLAVADGVAHPIWTDTRKIASRREEIYTTALDLRRLRVR